MHMKLDFDQNGSIKQDLNIFGPKKLYEVSGGQS